MGPGTRDAHEANLDRSGEVGDIDHVDVAGRSAAHCSRSFLTDEEVLLLAIGRVLEPPGIVDLRSTRDAVGVGDQRGNQHWIGGRATTNAVADIINQDATIPRQHEGNAVAHKRVVVSVVRRDGYRGHEDRVGACRQCGEIERHARRGPLDRRGDALSADGGPQDCCHVGDAGGIGGAAARGECHPAAGGSPEHVARGRDRQAILEHLNPELRIEGGASRAALVVALKNADADRRLTCCGEDHA